MADSPANRYEELAETTTTTAAAPTANSVETTLNNLKAAFGSAVLDINLQRAGQPAITLEPSALLNVARWLRDEGGYALLSDVTAQDCGNGTEPRFYVILHVRNLNRGELLRLRVGATEKKPRVASVVPIWPGANFPEREVYDLFGIEFEGHPNMKRIMLPDEWEGYPLRKDYPLVYEPIAFTHNADEIHASKPFAKE